MGRGLKHGYLPTAILACCACVLLLLLLDYGAPAKEENQSPTLQTADGHSKQGGHKKRRCQFYLDWSSSDGSNSFVYLNYKSFESALVTYPHCRFEVLVPAPQTAFYYRVGNLLSRHQFEKYSKMGFWIDMNMPTSKTYERTNLDTYTYWKDNVEGCCSFRASRRELIKAKAITFHFTFFWRLVALAEYGGFFSDFSWLHNPSHSLLPPSSSQPTSDGALIIKNNLNISTVSPASLLMFRPSSPIPPCVLRKFHYRGEDPLEEDNTAANLLLTCVYADKATGGVECLQTALDECFKRHNVTNVFASRSRVRSDPEAVEQMWEVDGGAKTSSLLTQNNLSAVWMGSKALDGQWRIPAKDSPAARHTATVDGLLASSSVVAKFIASSSPESQCRRPDTCSHYNLSLFPSTPEQQAQASTSCSPSFVMAGFMKAGTSLLWDCLTRHPQVVHALRGVVFKETGCYLPNSMRPRRAADRMHCFPFLEPSQGIVRGDGTVYNAAGRETPFHFRADNPNIKAILVIRNPVERAKSHHRFSFQSFKTFGLQNMNDVVDLALMPVPGGLSDMHTLAQSAVDASQADRQSIVRQLVDLYHKGVTRSCDRVKPNCDAKLYHRAANVLFHSIFFCPIWHWRNVLGEENVLVVPAESFDPRVSTSSGEKGQNIDETLAAVHSFLGICPWKLKSHSNLDLHLTFSSIPNNYTLNSNARARLERFFKPFNVLLAEVLQGNANGPKHLPSYLS